MKRIATLLLVFTMLLSLVACGGGNTNNDGSTNANNTTNNADHTTSSQEETTKGEETAENEITFTEMIAIDNEECTIKITGIEADNMWGYTVKALLENKSADKTYMFSVETAAINGVQCDPFFATEVAAGRNPTRKLALRTMYLKKTESPNILTLN